MQFSMLPRFEFNIINLWSHLVKIYRYEGNDVRDRKQDFASFRSKSQLVGNLAQGDYITLTSSLNTLQSSTPKWLSDIPQGMLYLVTSHGITSSYSQDLYGSLNVATYKKKLYNVKTLFLYQICFNYLSYNISLLSLL